jgi:KR domain
MREMIDEMYARGVEIIVRKGSVLDKATVEAVKEECKEYPVRGVVQGAMVLQDARVENMSYEQWRAAMDPKVQGTWNVHEIFGSSLDFFVLLSSSGGIVGSYSQGNYCAGNTFQDAFACYRAGLGLPGNHIRSHCDDTVADSFVGRSIDIGSVEGEGYTAENEAAAEFVRRQGLPPYKLEEFLVTIEEAIRILSQPRRPKLS